MMKFADEVLAYCPHCHDDVSYTAKKRTVLATVRKNNCSITENFALCNNCGKEIFVDDLEKKNNKNFLLEYNKKRQNTYRKMRKSA